MIRALRQVASLVGLAIAASATRLEAQATFVSVTPNYRVTVGASTTITLTIAWCSFVPGTTTMLDLSNRQVKVNGTVVSDYNLQWDPGACGYTGDISDQDLWTSQVDLTVSPGDQFYVYASAMTFGNYQYGGVSNIFGPPTRPALSIVPEAQFATVNPGARSARFTVSNIGNITMGAGLGVSCSGTGVSACSVSGGTTLAPGASAVLTVNYTAGSSPSNGLIKVYNSTDIADTSWTDVTVVPTPGTAGGVVIAGNSPGLNNIFDRSQCVTASLGDGAAVECGALRLAHPLPAVRTLGKQRAPTLIYNSATAYPKPIVQADVTIPTSWGAVPSSFQACVQVNSGAWVGCSTFAGSDWGALGVTRRIAIATDMSGASTGLYPYSVSVTANTGQSLAAAYGEMAVVNRASSPFGAGWWIAGVEQLYGLADGRRLVVGGDGSMRVYVPTSNPYIYTAANGTRADTLDATGADYIRRAPDGVEIHLSAANGGLIKYTKSRNGDSTVFTYNGSGCLTAISVPTRSSPLTYVLNCGSGSVTSITAPGLTSSDSSRRVLLYRSGVRTDSIRDPDGSRVRFGYDCCVAGFIVNRTNQLGKVTYYGFGAGLLVANNTHPLGVVVNYRIAENRGLYAAQPLDSVYTEIDGPRSDVADKTRFWVNGYGAPTRVRDAMGRETFIHYSSSWPALADSTVSPSRLVTRAFYNSRGLVDSVKVVNPNGDGQNAVTRYKWHSKWNAPVRVQSPTGLVDTTQLNATTGYPDWTQRGTSASTRATFFFNATTRQLDSTKTALGAKYTYLYNSTSGNLRATVDPRGIPSYVYQDAVGRDTLSVASRDTTATSEPSVLSSGNRTRTYYNVMDRVDSTRSYGPTVTAPGVSGGPNRVHSDSALIVAKLYDAVGRVTSIGRRYLADPRGGYGWTSLVNYNIYDDLGRVTQTISSEAGTTLFYKDLAGNDTGILTPRGHLIKQKFDALGRVTARISPQVAWGGAQPMISQITGTNYFTFPTQDNTSGLCVAGDTSYFRFDAVGNMRIAENGWATVYRSYLPGGALAAEAQDIRTYETSAPNPCGGGDRRGGARAGFGQHVYTMTYAYDLEGRRRTLTHPSLGYPTSCPSSPCQTTYGYNSALGTLDTVTGPMGVATRFGYDSEGRLTTMTHFNGQQTIYSYDSSGSLRSRSTPASTNVSYARDAFGRILTTSFASPPPTNGGTTTTVYGPHGPVVYNESNTSMYVVEEFITDAVGSRLWARTYSPPGAQSNYNAFRVHNYDSSRRLLGVIDTIPISNPARTGVYQGYADTTRTSYDGGGNVQNTFSWSSSPAGGSSWTKTPTEAWNLYDAENRLRVVDRAPNLNGLGVGANYEEYRYDALGRRVLVRLRCRSVGVNNPNCVSFIERTVWDGDQTLYELRAAGAVADSQKFEFEADTGGFRGAVGYVHGGAIDQPLVVYRFGASGNLYNWVGIVPFPNWRGDYEIGVVATGTYAGQRTNVCPGGTSGCPIVTWPGATTRVDGDKIDRFNTPIITWTGNLLSGRADGSGLMYRRNRYYDPASGRFTQADKIGLKGGWNLYALGMGDGINFADPSGDTIIVRDGQRDQLKQTMQTICTSSVAWKLCRELEISATRFELIGLNYGERGTAADFSSVAPAWTFGMACGAPSNTNDPSNFASTVTGDNSSAIATVFKPWLADKVVRDNPGVSHAGIVWHEMLRHWSGMLSKGCKTAHKEGDTAIDGPTKFEQVWWVGPVF